MPIVIENFTLYLKRDGVNVNAFFFCSYSSKDHFVFAAVIRTPLR